MFSVSRALTALSLIATLSVVQASSADPILPPTEASYDGILWNSVDGDFHYEIYLRFSKEATGNGRFVQLERAYEYNMLHMVTMGASSVGDYKVSEPLFLDFETGALITEQGRFVGISYVQRPDPDNKDINYGFRINDKMVSIDPSTRQINILPEKPVKLEKYIPVTTYLRKDD
jgi:hypothetical protein